MSFSSSPFPQQSPLQHAHTPGGQNAPGRLVVLGLDGLPLSLARTLAATGRFPALARLTENARAIRAELPELSPVNWTSFFTATGPEEHGIFGFTRIHAQTYEMALCSLAHVQTPTLFDRLGTAGLNSRIINLPNTYPARPLRGMMISGFVAHDLSRAVFPPMLAGALRQRGYQLEADTTRAADNPHALLEELRKTLASRRAALDLLWPDLAWNLFVLVLTETDRLFHFLFDAVTDPAHALHRQCLSLLMEWDSTIAALLERFDALPDPKRLIALADHGFTHLITEVDLNAFLRAEGLLHTALPPEACDELDASGILPSTRAFALDPGRIYLHTAARFARGQVSADDAAPLRERIRQALLALRHNGTPVLAAVHNAANLYPGPMQPFAPDLVCEPNPGFDLKAKFNRRDVFSLHGRTGTHTVHDVFFYDSTPPVMQAERVRDVGRLVLHHFGLAAAEPDAEPDAEPVPAPPASSSPATAR